MELRLTFGKTITKDYVYDVNDKLNLRLISTLYNTGAW
jgi:hypothetical protein